MDITTLIQTHESICLEARELIVKKNHDYGASWERDRKTSITDTIRHKVDRIIQLEDLQAKGESALVSEGVQAELIDIINYCIFRIIKED